MATTAKKGGKKKKEYSFKFLNRFMLIQFILIFGLCIVITELVANRAKENANNHITTIRHERMQVVENYAANAESTLTAFAKAPQIQQLLENQSDDTLQKEVQAYTVSFSEGLAGLDGLYVCNWDSKALAHSSGNIVGNVLLNNNLKTVQDKLIELGTTGSKSVYTVGMVDSKTTSGTVALSLVKAVYGKSGTPVGFVGFDLKTDDLQARLRELKTPGLDTAIYALLDCTEQRYILADDADAGSPIVIPDILNTINDVKTGTVPPDDIYEYKLPGMPRFIGTYELMPERNWMILFNAESGEVYALRNSMYIFMSIFTGLMIALMLLFTYLNRKQERVNERLLNSIEKAKETKASLNAAMYNDILTDVGNRIKFAIDIDGSDGRANPYYFALFNLIDLSNINTQFGNDSGDALLVRTADILKQKFDPSTVYRTGSDEFVVVFQTSSGSPSQETIMDSVNEVLRNLVQPEAVQGLGTIYPKFSVAVIKKTTDIDSSVVTIMKEMTKMKGEAVLGMIDFSDLSETSAY